MNFFDEVKEKVNNKINNIFKKNNNIFKINFKYIYI